STGCVFLPLLRQSASHLKMAVMTLGPESDILLMGVHTQINGSSRLLTLSASARNRFINGLVGTGAAIEEWEAQFRHGTDKHFSAGRADTKQTPDNGEPAAPRDRRVCRPPRCVEGILRASALR